MISNISLFDISILGKNSVILIIGKRAVGKTTLIKNIIKYKKEVDLCTIFDPIKNEYNDLTIPYNIHEEYDEITIFNLFKTVFNSEKKKLNLIILDNAIYFPFKKSSLIFKNLIVNNKINNTSLILSMQVSVANSYLAIDNIDYIFIFNDNNISNVQRFYQQYATKIFDTFDSFNKIYQLITKEAYTCIVIAKIIKSNEVEDNIFYLKVNPDIDPTS